jgi:exocyst complex component 4
MTRKMSSIKSLCHLLESLEWLTERVRQLAHVLSSDPSQLSRFWREATSPIIDSDGDMAASILSASLSKESVASLHDVVEKLQYLSDSCLILLRLEVRAQCLYHLLPTLRLSSYYCDAESVETDTRVVALNKSLVAFDEVLSAALTKVGGWVGGGQEWPDWRVCEREFWRAV